MPLQFETLSPLQYPLAKRFYKDQKSGIRLGSQDKVFVGREGSNIVAAYRLTSISLDRESNGEGHWLLRNMLVAADKQRQGIGSELLTATQSCLRPLRTFCFPYQHLESFYHAGGFERISYNAAPAAISEKYFQYLNQGRKILIMQIGGI